MVGVLNQGNLLQGTYGSLGRTLPFHLWKGYNNNHVKDVIIRNNN